MMEYVVLYTMGILRKNNILGVAKTLSLPTHPKSSRGQVVRPEVQVCVPYRASVSRKVESPKNGEIFAETL